MKHWNRNVFLGSHDLQERLRAEIVRRWPEAQYPFHTQVIAEDTTSTVEVRVWSDDGIHIFEEALPEPFSVSSESDPTHKWGTPRGALNSLPGRSRQNSTIAAVLHAVELAMREAASESLAINQGLPS